MRFLRSFYLLFFLNITGIYFVGAQPIRFTSAPNEIPLKFNGIDLTHPWAGGINTAQFNSIDLNNDGVLDIVVFDRSGNKLSAFLVLEEGSSVRYEYTEAYDDKFPALRDWVIFYDYNCDGYPDIFTYMPGGVKVYKNTTAQTGVLSFEHHHPANTPLGTPLHSKYESGFVNLFISAVNIPALYDVDGDGDMDILTFGSWGTTLHYHKNLSMEKYGNCDSLDFELANRCWGYFSESFSSNSLQLYDTCNYNVGNPAFTVDEVVQEGGARHEGATLCPLDAYGNGLTDLIIGDIEYWQMTLVKNGGTTSHAGIVDQDNTFPSYDKPIRLPEFLAAFYIDVDNDGKRDLLASPNLPNNSENSKSVWWYKNTGADNEPVFEFQQSNFLQDQMIDVGEGAIPVVVDINQDGLDDIIIANVRYFDTLTPFRQQFMYLKNVGTATVPAFEMITDDFLEMSQYNLGVGLVPTFGDVSGNGKPDMILGDIQGNLHFFENTSSGSSFTFNLVASPLIDQQNQTPIDVGFNAAPFLVDYSGNGKQDLIVGCRNGNVWYYQNNGQSSFDFQFVTDSLGKFSTALPSRPNNGFSTPFVKEINEELHLFVGSRHGTVYHYTDIYNPLTPFNLENENLLTYQGERTHVTGSYLHNDERLTLFMGNTRGGVNSYLQELVYADFSVEQQTICVNQSVQFFDETQGGVIAWNWAFEGGSPAASTVQNPLISYANPGQYDVSLTVTYEDGQETVTKEQFIVVRPNPTGEIDEVQSLICSSLCNGVLEVSASGETELSYTWSTGGNEAIASGLCEGLHNVIIADTFGCSLSLNYVLIAPEVEVDYTLETTQADCGEYDGCAQLLSYEGGTGESLTAEWHNGSTLDSLCGLYAGTYAITFRDENNCKFTYEYSILNPNAPVFGFEVIDETCSGDCDGELSVLINNEEMNYFYQWDNGLPNTFTQIDLCAGSYGVIVMDDSLCQSPIMYAEIEVEHPFPVIAFTVSTTELDLSLSSWVDFENETTGATSYLWDFGDGATSTVENPQHEYTSVGTYTVVLSAYNGPCFIEDSIEITVVNTASISEIVQPELSIFPNPTQNQVTIKHGYSGTIYLQVYAANGTHVKDVPLENSSTEVQLLNLSEGVYYFIFQTDQSPIIRKVVVVDKG